MHIVVIGGGPGGYVSAIRAAQIGAKVTLVEKKYLGGTCLNVGCIPTKVLLHTAETYHMLLHETKGMGLIVPEVKIDWEGLLEKKARVVDQLVGGVEMLLKSNGVEVIFGEAQFESNTQLTIKTEKGSEKLEFDKAIIATGSESIVLPIEGAQLPNVITSTEALSLESIPKSMCIIGGGVIGTEFASLYASLGSKVTIVEMLPELIGVMDSDIVSILKESLMQNEVDIFTSTRVEKIIDNQGLCMVHTDKGVFNVEKVLMATGRRPYTKNLGLLEIGVEMDRNAVKVDPKTMQSSVQNIYAIGDCNGGILLAHVASAEGIVAAEHALNLQPKMVLNTTPSAVYTKPELASVGLTEKEARQKGYAVTTGVFPLYANGKSLIMGDTSGILKFVVDGATDEILGIHMAGPRATDLIAEGALAIRLEATVDEIISTIHAHPTVSEAFHEAAHAVHNHAIHLPK